METLLLKTKFNIPPSKPGLVPRPHLIERLDSGLEGKLTLVSAPAGYGKTTLVSSWINSIQTPSVWFAVDEGDNDLSIFLASLSAAIQSRYPDIGEDMSIGLQAIQPPTSQHLLTTLINDLSTISTNLILVLDDYHFITSQVVHESLNYFLEHMPQQIHLVMTGRTDPQLHLSRLRAHGQLNEIRVSDLRFTLEEAVLFLQQVSGIKLSLSEIQALEERTEGWIAGLQLAAISMRGLEDASGFVQAFKGSHRFVIDYLVEEVLNQQSETLQDFLLKTSILERLNASLCNAVVEISNSQEIIAGLENDNLFVIPLDSERHWYRYHHLFAEFLRQRLNQKPGMDIPGLHLRASGWYQQQGHISLALKHALEGNDTAFAANLIEDYGLTRIMEGEVKTLHQWLNKIPSKDLRSNKRLNILMAWVQFLSGRLHEAEQSIHSSEQLIEQQDESGGYSPQSQNDKELMAEGLTIRSFIVRNQPGSGLQGIDLANQALQDIPDDNRNLRGLAEMSLGTSYRDIDEMEKSTSAYTSAVELCLTAGNYLAALNSMFQLSRMYVLQGKLHQAEAICRRGLEQAQLRKDHGLHRLPAEGMLHVGMGTVFYEWDQIDLAERSLHEGIRLGELGGFWDTALFGRIFLSRLQQSQGNNLEALATNAIALEAARASDAPIAYRNTTANQASLLIVQGNPAAAEQWAHQVEIESTEEISYLYEFEQLTLARFYLGMEQPDIASKKLQTLIKKVERSGRWGTAILMHTVQSLALNDLGEIDQAVAALEKALILAQPEGYQRTFVDLGNQLSPLLRGVITAGGATTSYAQQLLEVIDEFNHQQVSLKSGSMVDPLSERELEVLAFMNQGLSGPEIAKILFVSINTIKTHIKNIYSKLGVSKRFDAIQRAKDLGILIE